MTSPIKIIIKDNGLKKDGTAAVCIAKHFGRTRVVLNIGIFVDPKYFDKKSCRIKLLKGGLPKTQVELMNQTIDSTLSRAILIQNKYYSLKKVLTIDAFKREMTEDETSTDLYSFIEKQIIEIAPTKALGTVKHYKSTLTKLRDYKDKITFDDLNFDFVNGFEKYLVKRGLNVNSRNKQHKIFKVMLNWAFNRDIEFKDPYRKFRMVLGSVDRVHLTIDEIKRLMKQYHNKEVAPFSKKTLFYFLCSCLTGLRYSDLTNIKPKNIKGNLIKVKMQKTKYLEKSIDVPIDADTKKFIIENYIEDMTVPTNQYGNRQLKIIMQEAGINKNITFHCARHTFATLLLETHVPIDIVQELLGHNSIITTRGYVHTSDKRRIDAIATFGKAIHE